MKLNWFLLQILFLWIGAYNYEPKTGNSKTGLAGKLCQDNRSFESIKGGYALIRFLSDPNPRRMCKKEMQRRLSDGLESVEIDLKLTHASKILQSNDVTDDLPLSRSKYKVDSQIFRGVDSYAGFIPINEEYESNIFFWYFPKPGAVRHTPWIIWLQGGPGISSLTGIFEINGPFIIKDDKVHLRNKSWTNEYSVLYIDNPVGAGFSYTRNEKGYTTREDEVGVQLLEFLRRFLDVFPELRASPLFVAGESYAGKYVPTLSWHLHRHKSEAEYHVNLKGLLIGNGLIDPRSMMHYTELCQVLGILDDKESEELRKVETDAVKFLDAGKMVDAANKFNETIEYIKKHSSINILNFNEDGHFEFSFLDFLERPDVRDALHVGDASFETNNQLVYTDMLPDIMNTTKPLVEELLEHYGVLCYSGQLDVIVPYAGSKHLYSSLQWSGRQDYQNAARKSMKLHATGPVVGYRKSGGRFTDVVIRKAGHMAPRDQPDAVLHMLNDFIQEYSNADSNILPRS